MRSNYVNTKKHNVTAERSRFETYDLLAQYGE